MHLLGDLDGVAHELPADHGVAALQRRRGLHGVGVDGVNCEYHKSSGALTFSTASSPCMSSWGRNLRRAHRSDGEPQPQQSGGRVRPQKPLAEGTAASAPKEGHGETAVRDVTESARVCSYYSS